MAEQRALSMHPAILWDVIQRQAGSLGKAILEGVMNSVDAGSTFCDVTIDANSFSITDDGKGFRNEDEINQFFATFGTPHREGDATYGRFRMGRGQMFSFGRNVWRTGEFRMTVDLKPQEADKEKNGYALGYQFENKLKKEKGCKIEVELYEELAPSRLDSQIRELMKFVKYVDIPVRLNGKVISVDPAKEKWDEVTDDAYIKRKTSGNLEVYNLGVLVKDSPSYSSGVAGVVVSKSQLKVNFARNDIQHDCPVWKRVLKRLREQSMEKANRAAPITDEEREFFTANLVAGESKPSELLKTKVITDVTNSHHALSKLENVTKFTIGDVGDRVAEMTHTRKLAFVISTECAERFGASSPEEFKKIVHAMWERDRDRSRSWWRNPMDTLQPVPMSEFRKVISSNHEPLADKELNKAEMMALRAIRQGAQALYNAGVGADYRGVRGGETFYDVVRGDRRPQRQIWAGVSDTADGWTEGTRNIWVNRNILKKMSKGLDGFLEVAGLILHEYIHRGPSTDTHDHGVDFYRTFHNYVIDTDVLQKAAKAMLKSMTADLRKEGKALNSTLAALEDDVAMTKKLGIGGKEEDPAAAEVMSDDEFHAFLRAQKAGSEPTAEDGPEPTVLAAQSSDVVRRPRRKRAEDDSQFTLKF